MGHRPKWRLPLGHGQAHPFQSVGLPGQAQSVCSATVQGDRQIDRAAVRRDRPARREVLPASWWPDLGGESGRTSYGKPILILRKPRKKSLATRGATEHWPEGLTKRKDFLALGPWARGSCSKPSKAAIGRRMCGAMNSGPGCVTDAESVPTDENQVHQK